MGGVQKSAYAMQHAKDILLLRTMTERGRYLKTLHQSDSCIGTMGLHKSSGWKTAEYVAASKGIVNETLHYEVPGNFLEGKNYLAFITNEECMTGISKLVDDPDLLLQMKVNNRQYYENYLRPDMLIKQVLKIVEAD